MVIQETHYVDFVEMLCSEVLVIFADHLFLLRILTSFKKRNSNGKGTSVYAI